jgi:hypothetical protein
MNPVTLFTLLPRFAALAWTVGWLAIAAAPPLTLQGADSARRPNIVLILADDKCD